MRAVLILGALFTAGVFGILMVAQHREAATKSEAVSTAADAPGAVHLPAGDSAIVLCVRKRQGALQIVAQPLGSNTSYVLYSQNLAGHIPGVPDQLGFLPSPDGRRLLVWSVKRWDRYGQPAATEWSMIEVHSAEAQSLGVTTGEARLLPHWTGGNQLVLTGHGEDASIDSDEAGAAPRLPDPVLPENAEEALVGH